MKIVNLTPHPITVLNGNGDAIRSINSEKENGTPLPRLREEVRDEGDVDGIPLKVKSYGECENLPDPSPDTFYIVSGLIASAMKRDDLLIPNTVRDEKGQIIGCDSFSKHE